MCDVDELLDHWRWFLDWRVGCSGILRDWVVDTVAALCDEGATTLTIDALKDYALQPDQRVRLEREARAGEHKVEVGKATSHQLLLTKRVRESSYLTKNTRIVWQQEGRASNGVFWALTS
jgi:hypothetical protein